MKIISPNDKLIESIREAINKIADAFVNRKSKDLDILEEGVDKYMKHLESIDILENIQIFLHYSKNIFTLIVAFRLFGSQKEREIKVSRIY
jgi:hypothetical protein